MSIPENLLDPCRKDLSTRVFKELCRLAGEGVELGLDQMGVYALFEKPPESHLGDYAFPCFRFAKPLKKKPQEIAQLVCEGLLKDKGLWVDEVKVVNAFLNIFLKKAKLAADVLPRVLDGSLFKLYSQHPEHSRTRVMVEFSQPNTHKEFHVGHMRNVALGDSLCRLFRYNGYQVIAANYPGDECAHIAKCLWYIKRGNHQAPADDNAKGSWLGQMYVEATKLLEDPSMEASRPQMEQEISVVLKQIEHRSGEFYEQWKVTREWSLKDFSRIYEWLGVKFDHYFFESEVSEDSQKIVDEYLKKGVFVESEGAIGADLKNDKLGFMLVRKRDGNTLYATKDLVLARRKFDQFKINRSIYVVASEQEHHFKQVFKTLEHMGFSQAKACYHLSYGMVVLPDGKMASRKGNTITFDRLKDAMLKELNSHLEKYRGEWTKEEIEGVVHKLCVGAIKYGMLSSDPKREIVFDLPNWLSFEGNTGPYLMYSYARTQSIIRKAEEAGIYGEKSLELGLLKEPSEHEVLRFIYDFNDIVSESCETYRPSHLANHLFYMCKAFNRFYTEVPVLKAESDQLRAARLALIASFSKTLKQGLALLGIIPPERM